MKDSLEPRLAELLPSGLALQCVRSQLKKDERIFMEGERPSWMFYVVCGELALVRHGAGGETVFLQRQRSGFLAEASLVSDRYHCNALALEPTDVIKIPNRALKDSIAQDGAFAVRWITMLSAEVRRLRLQNERLSLSSVGDRLIHLVETEGALGVFGVQGSYKLLAQELGVTHEALYRCLAKLEKQGVLVREQKAIRLLARRTKSLDRL